MSNRQTLLLKRRVFKYTMNEEQWTQLSNLTKKYPSFFFVPITIHGLLHVYVVIPPAADRWAIYGEVAQIMGSRHRNHESSRLGVVEDARLVNDQGGASKKGHFEPS